MKNKEKIRHGSCPQEKNPNNYKIEEDKGNIIVSKKVLSSD